MRSLALVFALGCSAAGADFDTPFTVVETSDRPCKTTLLSPDEIIRDVVVTAAARWHSAHGCPVEVADGGIPVHAWARIFVEEDGYILRDTDPQLKYKQLCGAVRRRIDGRDLEIFLSKACDLEYNAVHEIGHLWGAVGTHAEDGVCAPSNSPTRSAFITESSLTWACSGLNCNSFNPER